MSLVHVSFIKHRFHRCVLNCVNELFKNHFLFVFTENSIDPTGPIYLIG
jgi:hypothetical protein